MARLPPHRRPHYPPAERMAILELKVARGWSLEQTARAFQVTAATIASWTRRLDEGGPDALVQIRQPVNRFPDVVRYLVQRLRTLCPGMGKRKIAETLARTALHLATTTVGRMLKEKPRHPPRLQAADQPSERVVKARYAGHVWHIDLTTVPTLSGFCCSRFPFVLPQWWPFCWWLAIVVDHFSRRAMGFAVFKGPPTSNAVRAFLGRTIATEKIAPRHLICDKGRQFWCDGFKPWCKRRGIKPRFGAVGCHGSISGS
ncbi:MAG: hypothetical protein A2V70_01565 [Planctomycetes bacterium RBG_13_63_9]|nr:MAG: hypothetical protein A2V70_01565 [Planctomycetes bacterium RBG_13_63_9]